MYELSPKLVRLILCIMNLNCKPDVSPPFSDRLLGTRVQLAIISTELQLGFSHEGTNYQLLTLETDGRKPSFSFFFL